MSVRFRTNLVQIEPQDEDFGVVSKLKSVPDRVAARLDLHCSYNQRSVESFILLVATLGTLAYTVWMCVRLVSDLRTPITLESAEDVSQLVAPGVIVCADRRIGHTLERPAYSRLWNREGGSSFVSELTELPEFQFKSLGLSNGPCFYSPPTLIMRSSRSVCTSSYARSFVKMTLIVATCLVRHTGI